MPHINCVFNITQEINSAFVALANLRDINALNNNNNNNNNNIEYQM